MSVCLFVIGFRLRFLFDCFILFLIFRQKAIVRIWPKSDAKIHEKHETF